MVRKAEQCTVVNNGRLEDAKIDQHQLRPRPLQNPTSKTKQRAHHDATTSKQL